MRKGIVLIILAALLLASCRMPVESQTETTFDIYSANTDSYIFDHWGIYKSGIPEEPDLIFLVVDYGYYASKQIHLLKFRVCDSKESSKIVYDHYREYYSDCIIEESAKWFIAHPWPMYDIDYTCMYYLEDNVVINGNIEEYSTWSDAETEPPGKFLRGDDFKEYIIDNAPRLKQFAMDLATTQPSEEE